MKECIGNCFKMKNVLYWKLFQYEGMYWKVFKTEGMYWNFSTMKE